MGACCGCKPDFRDFLPLLPVQSGDKALEVVVERVYAVLPHVPSCRAAWQEYRLVSGARGWWAAVAQRPGALLQSTGGG